MEQKNPKRHAKRYKMSYAEQIRFRGLEAAKVSHAENQTKISEQIGNLLAQVAAAQAELASDVELFNAAIQEALNSGATVVKTETQELPVSG